MALDLTDCQFHGPALPEPFVKFELEKQLGKLLAKATGADRKTVRKYIRRGLKAPKYKSRSPRVTMVAAFEAYLRERVSAWPELSGARLLREVRELGYRGGKTDDPFRSFSEWNSAADTKAYGKL